MSNVLDVKGVTQVFGGLVALNAIDLSVSEGEIVGVIGPNGAGKTTLFNAITGIIPPTSGDVFINGVSITKKQAYEITALGFARTFQSSRLFKKMTVLDNVLVGMHSRLSASFASSIFRTKKMREEEKHAEVRALEILELFDMADMRYEIVSRLPYGKQRELEIARALAAEPKLLLLDEPAAGLNEQETATLSDTILRLKEFGYTILLIEHDMKFVMKICEKIYVFNYGIKIAEGNPEQIKNNPDVIEAYLGKDV